MGTPCNEVFPLLHIKPAPSCSYMPKEFQHCCHRCEFSTGKSDKPVSLASRTENEKSWPKHVYKLNFIPFNLHYSFGLAPATEKYISPLMPSILTIQKSSF